MKEDYTTLYAAVVIPESPLKGSGNFGHLGRPGLRGGSADRVMPSEMSASDYADYLETLTPDQLDNTEYFENGVGYELYEARKLSPKEGKLKRITDRNSGMLWQDTDYIMNVEGEPFKVTKQEDPDDYDDDNKFVYHFQRMDRHIREPQPLISTGTSDPEELYNEIRNWKRSNLKGGEGSGNFEHAGRPGLVGGSQPNHEVVMGDHEKFTALKAKWASVNHELLNYIDDPKNPVAIEKMNELKQIVKDTYALKADPGGLEGIGLPGGPRDIAIIGAGPGGLAASVMGGTDGLDTVLIDSNTSVGGQAKFSSRIENYPGFPIGTTGDRLAGSMFEQAQRVGADTKLGVRVMGIDYDEVSGIKTLTLSTGEKIEARSVIIAGGVEFRKMDFPGADSPSVIYADGKRLAEAASGGNPVVVIGGSNGAAQAALGAVNNASYVTVLSRSPIEKGMSDYQVSALRHHPRISVIEGDEVDRLILGDDGLSKQLVTKAGKTINAKAVGIFVGGRSNTKWLPSSIRLKDNKIDVDGSLETTMPGVFAVGDIRVGSIGRIGAAVGDGQFASRSVFEYFERLRQRKG